MNPVMELEVKRSLGVYNFVSTPFGADTRMDLLSEKEQIRDGVF